MKKSTSGFTLVELLIVIVVIAILAAISVVAYNGIQNRAHDTAVKNDLSNIAKKAKLYHAEHGHYPWTGPQFQAMSLSVSKDAYDHYDNGSSTYNLVYCPSKVPEPDRFSLVAYSKSGNNFMYTADGALTSFPSGKQGSVTACSLSGIDGAGSTRYWFFDNAAWRSYL